MVSMTPPRPWMCRESRPVKASLVLTSIVSRVSRSKRPRVSTSKLRDWPDGIGPPGTVNTVATPRTSGRASSGGALLASSAMAATPWLAIEPTLHTSARCEWTTTSGGDSGWDPAGVRFSTGDVPPLRPVVVVGGGGGGHGHQAGEEENGQSEQDAFHWPLLQELGFGHDPNGGGSASVSSPSHGSSMAGGRSSPSPKIRGRRSYASTNMYPGRRLYAVTGANRGRRRWGVLT